ncbi:hypothetical protein PISMIDRAFT_15371 [Pisolithus microcarpus 441]|uniref:Unplaced genomic scaffold scaffold_154, whole genome shotgun sequence n=1 Tax=Pisolithus microcarpus 441 TaxID=765257 RepID=A0A0C9XX91_9AGAM|nr:hypothetical protein PISMIDRAFT_15371 [Pisolithus microcarpus 441]
MSSTLGTPSTRILNVVDDIIYVELTGALSWWDTHCFSVNIPSPGIKKVVLHLKDMVIDISLPTERKCILEQETLEQVKEASSRLEDARAALWKAYEGTVGIQDAFTQVVDASGRLDTIHNKLSVLRDATEFNGMELIKAKEVDCKPHMEPGLDSKNLCFECTSANPCRVLAHYTRNPNPGASSLTKPWAYHIILFKLSDIPTQLAKRKAPVDKSPDCTPKHAKLEIS